MTSLRFRPRTIPGESLASYVYRIAKANFYDSVSAFVLTTSTRVATIDKNDFDDEMLEILSDLSRNTKEHMEQMTTSNLEKSWGESLVQKAVLKEKVKYCPGCIKLTLHHKLEWFLRPIAVCLEHHSYLISKCQGCDSEISMSSFMSGFCNFCGFHYRTADADPVHLDKIVFKSQLELQRVFHQDPAGQSDVLQLAFHSYHLLEGLVSFVDDRHQVIRAISKTKKGYCSQDAALAYANYFWMYQNFPRNFRNVLDAFHDKRSTSKADLRKKFEKVFSGQRFPEIWSAYKAYWVDRVDEGAAHKSLSLFQEEADMLTARKYITQQEAMREFNVNTLQMQKLLGANLLKHHRVNRGATYELAIERSSLEQYMKSQERYISQEEVQRKLGVSRDTVTKLIKAQKLHRSGSPINQWMFDTEHVQDFLIRHRGRYVEGKVTGLTYQEATQRYRVEGFSIVELLTLINEKRIDAFTNKMDGTLSDSLVDAAQLERYIETLREKRREQKGYTTNELIRLLQISLQSLDELARQKILVPEHVEIKRNGNQVQWYNKSAVDAFRRDYCTISDAISLFSFSRKKLRTAMCKGRVVYIKLGMSKGYFLRKPDLEFLAEQNEHSTLAGKN